MKKRMKHLLIIVALCSAGMILVPFVIKDRNNEILAETLFLYGIILLPSAFVYLLPKKTRSQKAMKYIYLRIADIYKFKNESRKETREKLFLEISLEYKKGQKIPFHLLRKIIEETDKKENEKEILKKRWAYSFPE